MIRSRFGIARAVPFAAALALAACSGSHPASGPGAQYLAIATPANRALDRSFDSLDDNGHDDLTAAIGDLQAIVKTERAFDRELLAMKLPHAAESTARALVTCNVERAELTEQAATSTSLDAVRNFEPRLTAANGPVEEQVRKLRNQLDLPPPATD